MPAASIKPINYCAKKIQFLSNSSFLIGVNRCSPHPEKGWNSVKLAQPVPCVSAPPPAELSHPAGVWDAAVPLESLKFAVQPGPRNKTEEKKKDPFRTKQKTILKGCTWVYMTSDWVMSPHVPESDVFCSSDSSSSDSDPRSRSLPPFSMLLLELPSEVWETPNLGTNGNRYKLRKDGRIYRTQKFLQ